MRDSLTLGRIAGIRFGVNWSWAIVFALIVWTLATGIFPSTNPGHDQRTYIAMAIVAALLFFTSLLMHEFGHALEAKREGVEIEGITLWLFGGVAKFRGMFPSAGAEFRIAIAGPLVSLVLGAIFVLLAWKASLPEVADGVAAWLGYINLTLLVFNLLPALPLDGGRVLRSALWGASGNLGWATHVAALIGRGFGYLFIVGGVALVIWQSAYSGIWIAFIGWFLLQAAAAEDRTLLARQALRGLRVRDVVVRDPVTTRPDVTLGEFMDDIALDDPPRDIPRHRQRPRRRAPPSPLRRRGAAQRVGDTNGARLHAPAREDPGRARGRRSLRRGGRVLGRRPLARARPRRRPLRRAPLLVRRAARARAAPRPAALGVTDGTRTRDSRDHNPGLYQLSYGHHARCSVARVLRSSPTRP